ncbi:azurin [Gelidibacter algens]|jgi:azurin|uniref:Azurin n=1 Tax=Gelidibacter algens TaxID=49280 RepID=A0A1A7R0J7_9FLAO|nr:azurin [Gelidibacter algens]OBX25341.1 azurin [Gelidibacter algens]RAJ25194.1 azurin [Gelidibacter algens]
MKKLVVVCLAAVAFSCGESKKEEKPELNISTQMEEKTAPAEATDSKVAVVSIEGNDQMKFNKDEIRVKAGQTVKLTLTHVGKMDKAVMGHNWALLTQDADMAAVGQAAAAAADNDYIPEDMSDKIIVYTKMLGGGESVTIEFEAPAAGTYTFMCTFPGHYALMNGKFIVE